MTWLKRLLVGFAALAAVIYFALPPALTAMGLHPHYDVPPYDLSGKRALVLTTSHGVLGETSRATGVFGSEMTVPYYAFLDAGMTVDIASIKGGEIPVEPFSMGWPLATESDYRFKKDLDAMDKLQNSLPIDRVDPNNYDAIFLAGGWGAAYDFAQSDNLAAFITRANANGAVLGSVCHGALGLVNATDTSGSPLLEGRAVTGVTDKQVRELGIEITPKHPETELRSAKASFESSSGWRDIFASHVVVDGNLVTGQNQNDGAETAHRMLEILIQ